MQEYTMKTQKPYTQGTFKAVRSTSKQNKNQKQSESNLFLLNSDIPPINPYSD